MRDKKRVISGTKKGSFRRGTKKGSFRKFMGTKKGSFRKFINKILILFGLTQFDLIQTSDMYGYGLRNSHVQLIT